MSSSVSSCINSSLTGKRIAVIGASGYIGSHVVDMFLEESCYVHALSRTTPGLIDPKSIRNKNLRLSSVDVCDYQRLSKLLVDIDIIVYLVSSSLPLTSNSNPRGDVNVNLIGALNVLEIAKNENIQKFVFISSGGTVYGNSCIVPIPENHPTNPICSYGIVKLAIEKYISLYSNLYNINSTILRLANPYGGRQKLDSGQGVVPAFLSRAINSQTLEVWGDGSTIRDFLYISDVTRAVRLACSYSGRELIFNIGSGTGLSLLELIKLIQTTLNRPVDVVFKDKRDIDVPSNVLSITKAASYLNWSPQVSPIDGIEQFYRYLLSLD